MTRLVLLCPLLLPLAGCGPAASPAPARKAAPAEHGYIARVKALPPRQLEGVLFRAIAKGGGEGCQGVRHVEPMASPRADQPAWRVECSEGSFWRVALADDGTAYVTGTRS